jgi:hypothetical protein
MRILRETTDWAFPNHIYYLDDKKENLIAFININTHEPKVFKKPIRFDMRHRTFVEVKDLAVKASVPQGRAVQGSKGETYYVDEGTCTCPGFKFRGACRHVAEIQQMA